MNLFRIYNNLLNTRPITTKALTSSFLFGLGDGICQVFVEKSSKKDNQTFQYDFRRTKNFALMGLALGPVFHFWYGALARLTTASPISNFSKGGQALSTMLIDQTAFALGVNCFFQIGLSFLETNGIQQGLDNINTKLWAIMKTNWSIWPAAQMINFYVIPLQYRVLWANVIGLFWNVALSYLTNSKQSDEKSESA